jgi:hypothetical protein
MHNRVDAFDCIVKRAILSSPMSNQHMHSSGDSSDEGLRTHPRNVVDDDHLEFVAVCCERRLKMLALLRVTHRAAHGVAGFEELVDDVHRDVAIRAGDED